jgi:selenocysteine lyase/cysteine desulfurase
MPNKIAPPPIDSFPKLEETAYLALQMYSNVHRGAGHNSLVSTRLFDQSRDVVLDYLDLPRRDFEVIFANLQRVKALTRLVGKGACQVITSQEIGLPMGVCAVAIRKEKLPKGIPYETGGGTVRVVSEDHVLWAGPPDRYEAGTPAILNIIIFARALQLHKQNPKVFTQKEGDLKKLLSLIKNPAPAGMRGESLLAWLKPRLVGRNVLVPTEMGKIPYTNLDNGASTPSFEPVWECFRQSLHIPESEYATLTREARKICLDFVGAPEKDFELVFISNTTEGLNTFARLVSASLPSGKEMLILNSLIEHNSNELPWRHTPGLNLIRLEADEDGFIDTARLEELLKAHNSQGSTGIPVRWVSISGASNVLGALNDLESISAVTHKYGAKLLVDAAQLIAHRSIDMQTSGIDALVFSGHKVYAPYGSGALILRKTAFNLDQKMVSELKSSGEENVAGISGLAAVFSLLKRIGMDIVEEDERVLTLQLLDGLRNLPGVKVYGIRDGNHPQMHRRSGVVTLELGDTPFNIASNRLAEVGGVGVRSGCFCSHLLVKRLLKVGAFRARLVDFGFTFLSRFTKLVMPGLVRISIGLENTPEEIRHCLETVRKVISEKQPWYNRMIARNHNGSPFFNSPPIAAVMEAYVDEIASRVFDS